jgi:hypothetical protein
MLGRSQDVPNTTTGDQRLASLLHVHALIRHVDIALYYDFSLFGYAASLQLDHRPAYQCPCGTA